MGVPVRRPDPLGLLPRTQPNAVVTSFAAHALMDVEELGPPGRFTATIDSALVYARSHLVVEQGEEAFFAYYEGSRVPIHNANLLVASVFARRGRVADALPRFATRSRGSGPTVLGLRGAG